MAEIKICEIDEAPEDGTSKRIDLIHPVTEYEYQLAMFRVGERLFLINDKCKNCNSNLTQGTLNGMFASCPMEEHPWHIKTGLLKYDRTTNMPTYKIHTKDDGLYIEI